MLLKTGRFAAILLVAVLATMTCSHLWQLPARMQYERALWFNTLDLYAQIGPKGVGASIERAAIGAAAVLAVLSGGRRAVLALALGATSILVAFV